MLDTTNSQVNPVIYPNRRSTPKNYAVWEIHPVTKMEAIP
jgi:hypothetical protein